MSVGRALGTGWSSFEQARTRHPNRRCPGDFEQAPPVGALLGGERGLVIDLASAACRGQLRRQAAHLGLQGVEFGVEPRDPVVVRCVGHGIPPLFRGTGLP